MTDFHLLTRLMKTAEPIILTSSERSTIDSWATGRSIPYRLVERARIISMAADGTLNQDIAQELQISRPTVQLWRQRFLSLRLSGLEKDAPRPGRKPRITQRKINAIIETTLQKTPPNATHWSTRCGQGSRRQQSHLCGAILYVFILSLCLTPGAARA